MSVAMTVKPTLTRCKVLVSPEVWVSDTGSHFKNRVEQALVKALMFRRFIVTTSPWSHREYERMMHEIVRKSRVMLQEERCDAHVWVCLVPAVPSVSNEDF